MESIIVQGIVKASKERVWDCWTKEEQVIEWNNASADWHTSHAKNDLMVGGSFLYRMEARDGSAGFDFTGTYTDIRPYEHITYTMGDGRTVEVTFIETPEGILVRETFEPEDENSEEIQRSGWQAILDNFKKYVESF